MIPVYNVKFQIKRKNSPEHSSLFWSRYSRNTINIPDNIYKEYSRCINYTDIISAYLIGWFYKYNEDIIHLDDIEEVLVENWSLEND